MLERASLLSIMAIALATVADSTKDFELVPAECSDRDRARAQARFSKMKASDVEAKFSSICELER